MPKINALPYFCIERLSKKWRNVQTLHNGATVCASKTNKRGEVVQLIVSDKGQKREFLYPDKKIMIITDDNGVKRTYIYKRNSEGTINGEMIAVNGNNKSPILVQAANWILENFHLQKLTLKINPQHKNSKTFIHVEHLKSANDADNLWGFGKEITVRQIIAKDFETDPKVSPRTIIFETDKSDLETVSSLSAEDNKKYINQFEMRSDVLGNNLMTVV